MAMKAMFLLLVVSSWVLSYGIAQDIGREHVNLPRKAMMGHEYDKDGHPYAPKISTTEYDTRRDLDDVSVTVNTGKPKCTTNVGSCANGCFLLRRKDHTQCIQDDCQLCVKI